MTQNQESTLSLEVAVYPVSDAGAFDPLQALAHRRVAAYDGFVMGYALRAIENVALRADVIMWANLSAAKAASAALMKDDDLAAFREALGPIRHFAHYAGAGREGLAAVGRAPVVEIAAYRGRQGGPLDRLQPAVHAALPRVDGVRSSVAGTRADGERGHLDLIGWRDVAAMNAAPPQIVAIDPSVAPFFDAIEETFVFDPFEVLRVGR